jgi:hypothetical protein
MTQISREFFIVENDIQYLDIVPIIDFKGILIVATSRGLCFMKDYKLIPVPIGVNKGEKPGRNE